MILQSLIVIIKHVYVILNRALIYIYCIVIVSLYHRYAKYIGGV